MVFKKKIDLVSGVLFLICLVLLSFCIWALDKGLDFSDEAFSYLGYAYPDEKNQTITYYVQLIVTFFGWVNLTNIVHVRILMLTFIILCSAVFAHGLSGWVSHNPHFSEIKPINLYFFILLGSLLIYATGSQGLTYNLISVSLFQLIIGLFFITFPVTSAALIRKELIVSFFIGALLFALFMVKFSNSILLAIVLLSLLIFRKRNLKAVLLCCLAVLAGALILALFIFGIGGFIQWTSEFLAVLSTQGSYSVSLLKTYQEDFNHVKNDLILPNLGKAMLGIFLLVLTFFITKELWRYLTAFFFLVILGFTTLTNKYYLGGAQHAYTLTFTYIFLVLQLTISMLFVLLINYYKKTKGTISRETFLVFLILLATPFVGTLGTTNYLSYLTIVYFAFVFAFIYLLSSFFGKALTSGLILLLSVNAAYEIFTSLVYYPYRLNTPRHEQTLTVAGLDNIANIKFDSVTKKSIEQTRDLISSTRYTGGMPIFAFRSEYGLIFAMNGILPGWFWYRDETSAQNCVSLKKSELKNLDQTIFIFPKNYAVDSTFQACLRDLKIDFPAGYDTLGEVEYYSEKSSRPLLIHAPKGLLK